jgi:drug/metabolite transporter (DMT)-like permease
MHLLFDIFQGIGIASAVGIRPFLPVLAVGALASGDVQIDFNGTDFAFLEGVPWLLAMLLCAIALALLERRLGQGKIERPPGLVLFVAIALALGAIMFGGALAQNHHPRWSTDWPGFPAGIACALVGLAAMRPLFARARARLDPQAASAVTLYAEAIAVVFAIVSVVAPPAGVVGLLALCWMLVAGRRQKGKKYAGLRILR